MSTLKIVKDPGKQVRLLARRVLLRAVGIGVELEVPTLTVGSGDGALIICPTGVDRDSVVYSFGIGRMVTWDEAMIDRFGLTVHAFDPGPVCADWVEERALPDEFVFHPYGVGVVDGSIKFYPPPTAKTVNYSTINRAKVVEERAEIFPVKRLETICNELGHDHVDILKIDIEGGEFEVLPEVMESGVPIHQILLEVHHHFGHLKFEHTRRLIARLRDHGYRIFGISQRGREISLLHRP